MRYPELVSVSVEDGQRGIEMIETESPDIVIASSSLPDIGNIEFLTKVREFSDVPIIIASETGTDMDRARGLEAGADEYVTKPLNPIEFLAITNALLRRTTGIGFKPERTTSIQGELTINFTTHEVHRCGKQVHLTPIEYNLLAELVRNSGRIITQRTLLEKVWGSEYADDINFLKKYIYRLRSKLEREPGKPQMLITERGLGYKFIKPII
jgi:two-component system KDP operon response regulator KdpE